LIGIAWIIYIIDFIVKNFVLGYDTLGLMILPTISAIFFRFFIFYNSNYANLVPLVLMTKEMEKLALKEPEMVLIKFNTEKHIYPIAYLRVNDVMYKNKDNRIPDYSLTFCVLCNTAHAYELPIIEGKQIEITSNNGSILNGNKILADKNGKYIWQQFTGEGLKDKTKNIPLKEISIIRGKWDDFREDYPNSLVYKGNRPFLSRFFFKKLANIMKNNEAFSFSSGKRDKRLKRKEMVVGVENNEKSKAYPISVFKKDKITLLVDKLGNEIITLVHRKGSTFVYKEEGLNLQESRLEKNGNTWTITGEALGDSNNLESIKVTDKAYWYMWSKFHPNTDIYQNLKT
jgi:hypothetical protein